MTPVTAADARRAYLLLIEHEITAAFATKFCSLFLAAAFLLPAALTTLNQAALIVA